MTDRRSTDAPASTNRDSAETALTDLNARTAKRQRMLLAGIASILLGASSWFVFGSDKAHKAHKDGDAQTIETAGLVNRDLSQREFVNIYGNRLDAVTRDQKALKESAVAKPELEAQLTALKAENQAMKSDGKAAIDAISAENAALKSQLQAQAAAPPPPPAATMPAYGPKAGGYDARGHTAPGLAPKGSGSFGATPDGTPPPAEVKLMSFGGEKGASNGSTFKVARADSPPLVVEDSPDYLPPNSYAPARVIVGVDASAGVASQTDPLPVVLRITGPARSVMQNGRVLTTRLQGCVINGAARGDLSSEKVYVKLARMTCDQPGGRVAVSEVKGFISFAGKSGVRGHVVSREGNLITQALLAGVVGGFGRGFSANANSVFSGQQTSTNGTKPQLSAGDIFGGGLGQGAASAADTVSKYLIERAEQYQPVVEMPTGIDVEVVFLDGVFVRKSQ
jgi:conjugal transfer pilus assembly protein TraB